MLPSTLRPAYSWIDPGLLAFSSARPSTQKKEEQTCSSLLHTCLASPQVTRSARARQRCGLDIGTASGVFQNQGGVARLRGGSSDERDRSRQPPEGNGQSTPTGGTPNVDTHFAQQRTPAGDRREGAVFGGVALVTERSTATGGSTGRRRYSVLPDGTLQVGPISSVSTHPIEVDLNFSNILSAHNSWCIICSSVFGEGRRAVGSAVSFLPFLTLSGSRLAEPCSAL